MKYFSKYVMYNNATMLQYKLFPTYVVAEVRESCRIADRDQGGVLESFQPRDRQAVVAHPLQRSEVEFSGGKKH